MPEEMPSSMARDAEVVAAPADFENPFATEDSAQAALPRGGANVHGSFSIETFCDQGSLSLTHEDAAGWRNYLNKFNPSNFWYADGGVQPWAYYEEYDNWQDTYGMDAVMAAYHSGHGGMDANGVFYVPMGHDWGGLGCTATSNNMRLGNEHLRYLFWSTCESLRVFGGQSPDPHLAAGQPGRAHDLRFRNHQLGQCPLRQVLLGGVEQGQVVQHRLGWTPAGASRTTRGRPWPPAAPASKRRRTACSTNAFSTAPRPAATGGGGAGTPPPAPPARPSAACRASCSWRTCGR